MLRGAASHVSMPSHGEVSKWFAAACALLTVTSCTYEAMPGLPGKAFAAVLFRPSGSNDEGASILLQFFRRSVNFHRIVATDLAHTWWNGRPPPDHAARRQNSGATSASCNAAIAGWIVGRHSTRPGDPSQRMPGPASELFS